MLDFMVTLMIFVVISGFIYLSIRRGCKDIDRSIAFRSLLKQFKTFEEYQTYCIETGYWNKWEKEWKFKLF